MRWLVDGYNAIRRWPELAAAEQRHGLQGGRDALCALLSRAARASGDEFTVVFDGAQAGGVGHGGPGVRVVFSSARESADRVIAQMAASGGAVVSSDREVRRAAARAGAVVITADEFLARIERLVRQAARPTAAADPDAEGDGEEGGGDDGEDAPRGPKKGNPRKLSKKRRAAERALGRLRSDP
jgi:predicted RNA-binding protein with PIN domain